MIKINISRINNLNKKIQFIYLNNTTLKILISISLIPFNHHKEKYINIAMTLREITNNFLKESYFLHIYILNIFT